MTMKLSVILLFCLGSCLLVKPARAFNPEQEPFKSIIERGIELTVTNQFDEACQLYEGMIENYPDYPAGYFYYGATLQAQMLDEEDYKDANHFYDLMDRAINLNDSLMNNGSADAWAIFYGGSACLYRGFMKMKEGRWFASYKDASRGVGLLEKAVAIDSTLYDAYLGIGSYRYWKSAKADFLTWLPFIADHRREAISMIRQAIEKGLFVKYVGRDQLVWILMDYGDFETALKLAGENYRDYPRSRFFRWTLASAAFRSGELAQSYGLYQQLLEEVKQLPDNNHFNEVECLVNMARVEKLRHNWNKAYEWSDQALRTSLEREIRERARNKLRKALEIREEALKYLGSQ
jgi:tetratricopeptide (TPR) repeat protein